MVVYTSPEILSGNTKYSRATVELILDALEKLTPEGNETKNWRNRELGLSRRPPIFLPLRVFYSTTIFHGRRKFCSSVTK